MNEIRINNKIIYYYNFLSSPEKIDEKLNELNEVSNQLEVISQFNTLDNLQQVKVLFIVKLIFIDELTKEKFLTSKGINKPKLTIT